MKDKKFSITKSKLQDILGTESEISHKELESIIERVESTSEPIPHWLVVTLKVLAYALGLILAGIGTTASAATLFFN